MNHDTLAGERAEARASVERQNALEVPERDANSYRLVPHESRLDWLEANPTPRAREPGREDRLDCLKEATPERDQHAEVDRERES